MEGDKNKESAAPVEKLSEEVAGLEVNDKEELDDERQHYLNNKKHR